MAPDGPLSTPDRPWTQHYADGVPVDVDVTQWPHVPAFLRDAASRFKTRPAFVTCLPNGMAGTLSYGEIDEMSDGFAVYLREILKLSAGDRVAVQLPNCLAYPIVAFGVFKAGCALVNVNPLYTGSEMVPLLKDAEARVLIGIDLFGDKIEHVLPQTQVEHVVMTRIAEYFPLIPSFIVGTVQKYVQKTIPKTSFKSTRLNAAVDQGMALVFKNADLAKGYAEEIKPESMAALQFTGGTTGVSKAAMLSHANLIANLCQSNAVLGNRMKEDGECVMTVLPLYHIFAFTVNLFVFFGKGALNLLIPNPRPLTNLQKAFAKYNVTWLPGVNTLFNGLLNEEWFTSSPPKEITACAGGMALQPAVGERWEKMIGRPVFEGYGLTETSPVVTFQPLNHPPRLGTIGIPVPSTDVVIMDEAGTILAPGEVGEIAVKGPQVMQGYYNRPEETAKVMRDGWFLTGDIGVMEADGYVRIVDRKKDMIIVSGFNVYPNEIEDVIVRHPDVLEVAVVGVPFEETGEAVQAFIVPKPELEQRLTAEAVIAHCREHLTNYKVPKQIVFRDELPKSPVGKILRKDLRGQATAAAGER